MDTDYIFHKPKIKKEKKVILKEEIVEETFFFNGHLVGKGAIVRLVQENTPSAV